MRHKDRHDRQCEKSANFGSELGVAQGAAADRARSRRLLGAFAAHTSYLALMATVHLVCGFLGSGKTTFAKALTAREAAIRFSVDEWYLRLFAEGPTYELDREAMTRLLAVLNDLWPELAQAGSNVVLDFGFWHRSLRDEVRDRARAVGASVRLHWLRCPDPLAIARCLARNGQPGSFLISEQGFHDLKPYFEAPARDEPHELVEPDAEGGAIEILPRD
ncbi:MAG: ATP-binding protein [Pseudomonadota bacterium]